MSLKSYIMLMIITTFACYLTLGAIIFFFDPMAGGILILAFFYISLFLSLVGTLSLLGLFMRLFFTKDKLMFKKVVTSFRQAILFAILIIVALYLNSFEMFSWKYLICLIIGLTLLEIFFISYKPKHVKI